MNMPSVDQLSEVDREIGDPSSSFECVRVFGGAFDKKIRYYCLGFIVFVRVHAVISWRTGDAGMRDDIDAESSELVRVSFPPPLHRRLKLQVRDDECDGDHATTEEFMEQSVVMLGCSGDPTTPDAEHEQVNAAGLVQSRY